MQSRVLVWVVGALLVWMSCLTLRQDCVWFSSWYRGSGASFPWTIVFTIGISIIFAVLVLALHAATVAGAFFGGLICLLLMNETVSCILPLYDLL